VTHQCEFCKKSFVKESSLAVHSCEPRRRRQEQNEPGVRLALYGYLKFYEISQGSARLKTFEDFAESPYYRAFVRFGRYCVNTRVINPEQFMVWLLKQNKKIDHWCRDSVYTEYLIGYLQTESVDDALARAMEFGIAWQETTGSPAQDCMRYGNANVICHAITAGRISAWAIYNSDSGQQFLGDLTPELVSVIWPYIDADAWQKRFRDYPADVEYARDILKKAGW
jgi:hypothetical protein